MGRLPGKPDECAATDRAQAGAAVRRAVERFGRLDTLVSNADLIGTSGQPTSTTSSSLTSSPPTRVGHLRFTQLPRTAVAPTPRASPGPADPGVTTLTMIGTVLLGLGALLAGTSLRSPRNPCEPQE